MVKYIERVKELFLYVEKNYNKYTLNEMFKKFANKWEMNVGSVRNLFYMQIKKMSSDDKYKQKVGIDLENICINSFVNFDEKQEKDLLEYIENGVKSGHSVRALCLELANGDIKKMIRYQNKYRNLIKTNAVIPNNIIPFESKKSVLNDGEIESLFLGLVKLVKDATMAEATKKVENILLTKTKMINELQNEIKEKDEQMREERLKNLRYAEIEKVLNLSKIEDFKSFMEKIKKQSKIL